MALSILSRPRARSSRTASGVQQVLERSGARARGKHRIVQLARSDVVVCQQDALEHRTQIGGWLQIPTFIKRARIQSRPVGNHPSTVDRAAQDERARTRAMISAACSIE